MRLGWLKPLALAFARTRLGQRYISSILKAYPEMYRRYAPLSFEAHPEVCIETLQRYFNERLTFDSIEVPTHAIKGFEDLTWLFACNSSNMGIIRLAFDEAAYLFRLVQSLRAAKCVEIGRYKGGSTFLIAAAMDEHSLMLSIDNHSKMAGGFNYNALENALCKALETCQLRHKVELVVADSTAVPAELEAYDLVFVDGDHNYAGVSKDYQHWKYSIKPGGHLLFHDAASSRPYTTVHEGPARLVREIEINEGRFFTKKAEIGSLVHFIRTNVRWK